VPTIVPENQGDRMSLPKTITQNVAQTFFVANNTNLLLWKKVTPKIWPSFVVKKIPKEKNHPIGQKSPHLVTLLQTKEPNWLFKVHTQQKPEENKAESIFD
jgi:hypothetical protein